MRLSAVLVVSLLAFGCEKTGQDEVPRPTQTPAHSTRAAPGAGGPMMPSHPGTDVPASVPSSVPSDEQIAALQDAFDKTPTNDAAKSALVEALVARANYFMTTNDVPPREKYPKALGLYRRAAKIDPNNATAQAGIGQIEDIYRSMQRPIPET